MKNLKCIAVVETGGDMCIAVGGEDVVQLVICSKSGRMFPRIKHNTLHKFY